MHADSIGGQSIGFLQSRRPDMLLGKKLAILLGRARLPCCRIDVHWGPETRGNSAPETSSNINKRMCQAHSVSFLLSRYVI